MACFGTQTSTVTTLFQKSAILFFITLPYLASTTSIKLDFLPVAEVRTDPIVNPTCLSDHVHTFYGAGAVRPEVTSNDLKSTKTNSGNTEENGSLYWHPSIYKYVSSTDSFEKVDIWFSSAYYVWDTGNTTAWPENFKMIAHSTAYTGAPWNDDGTYGTTHTKFECVNPHPCERSDCTFHADKSSTPNYNELGAYAMPLTACGELEVSMRFPSCWDGANSDSVDHASHVAYTSDGEVDSPCPDSHQVKIPQIRFYWRISDYQGGHHQFSNGLQLYHADYMSGWNQNFLQDLLDNCQNPSMTADPTSFCEEYLTYRGGGKITGKQSEDDTIVPKLEMITGKATGVDHEGDDVQVPLDTSTITSEAVNSISVLPRGACTGTLLPAPSTPSSTTQPAAKEFEWVDGGRNRACRGADKDDDKPSYKIVRRGKVFKGEQGMEACEELCIRTEGCKGIEHAKWGRCEIWTRSEGIQASIQKRGSLCMRYGTSSIDLRQAQRRSRKHSFLGPALLQTKTARTRTLPTQEL